MTRLGRTSRSKTHDRSLRQMNFICLEDVDEGCKTGGQGENTTAEPFTINIGTPQGDCISSTLFTIISSKSIYPRTIPNQNLFMTTHTRGKKVTWNNQVSRGSCSTTHTRSTNHTTLSLICNMQTIPAGLEQRAATEYRPKKITLALLANRNLNINESKTKEYTISRGAGDEWKVLRPRLTPEHRHRFHKMKTTGTTGTQETNKCVLRHARI